MGYLKKEQLFFERDGEGKLLPIDVVLETYDNETMVQVRPLTKGEFAELSVNIKSNSDNSDLDIDLIIKHCVNPSFSETDRKELKESGKIMLTSSISTAIMSVSTGVSQKQLIEDGKKQVVKTELEELQKK